MTSTLRDKTVADVGLRQPLRTPFERWPAATDLLIAGAAFALTLGLWSSAAGAQGLNLDSLAGIAAWLVGFIACFALLWRRSHPLPVHGVVLVMSVCVLMGPLTDGIVALVFSLYSVGRYESVARDSLFGLCVALVYVMFDAGFGRILSTEVVLTSIMAFAVWYVGRRLRFRGEYLRLLEERAQHLERQKTLDAERAVAAERTRIAREMHDVVAHKVSLMTVQAGAARTIASANPIAASDAMAAVETAGRHALSEMRQLLGVLRPAQDSGDLAPQPGVPDLDALVRQVCQVGPDVELVTRGPVSELPASVGLNIYRIVQEALTNVIKHAGDDVSVEVGVTVEEDRVVVLVRDNGRGASANEQSGYGIAGMCERVALMRGTLSAGNGRHGGFEVCAQWPVDPKTAEGPGR